MANNKFGKLLIFSAAAGAIAAGTYYFLQNKDKFLKKKTEDEPDDDFDDEFDEDLDAEPERSYVPLNTEETDNKTATADTGSPENAETDNSGKKSGPQTDSTEKVEEFFDEEDAEES